MSESIILGSILILVVVIFFKVQNIESKVDKIERKVVWEPFVDKYTQEQIEKSDRAMEALLNRTPIEEDDS